MRTKRFVKQSEILAPVEAVFAFHERPDAFARLTPPWERVEIVEPPIGLQPGTRAVIKTFFGPIAKLWVAEHTEYEKNRLFADVQRSGPFAYWYHRHLFQPTARGTTIYTDEIEYALPLGRVADLLAGSIVLAKLERLFDYRHQIVAEQVKVSHPNHND
jgi:ligand-binding SRPBCC domain-containing protein